MQAEYLVQETLVALTGRVVKGSQEVIRGQDRNELAMT